MNKQDGKAELIGGVQKGPFVVASVDIELLDENQKAANACPMQIIKINK
jgi:ferredoxin